MDTLVGEGVTSFKIFMAYPGVLHVTDKEIFRAMDRRREIGALIMMHAENGIAIDVHRRPGARAGPHGPVYHGLTRPPSS